MTTDPLTTLATAQRLVEASAAHGIHFLFFPSGTVCFAPREITAKHPALLAELQAHRQGIADYLRTMGDDGAESNIRIEAYSPMYTALREGKG